jgi:hypothetical protein
MQPPPIPSSTPKPKSAGSAVVTAGGICFLLAAISIVAQPVLLAFIHGPLAGICILLAIIAICKDEVRGGVQLLLASIFALPVIFGLSFCLWAMILGALFTSAGAASHVASAATTPSPSPSIVSRVTSKPSPTSFESVKTKFLDQIRRLDAVIIADFKADQEIEIEIMPDVNFDSAKAKKAALVVAQQWKELSGQHPVSVSIWQGANLLAKEGTP